MLQTCTRCRSRRIKCDSLLPACANCAKSDLECTFHDDALQEDIPRSYIQTLNERIEHLTSQLSLHRTEGSPRNLPTNESIGSDLPGNASSQPLHIVIPARPGSDLHLDNSVPSRFVRIVFEALPSATAAIENENHSALDDHCSVPKVSYTDRSALTPNVLRFLLGRYDRCVKSKYDVIMPALVNYDLSTFKKLPDASRFRILMACAIAAAQESYRSPNWKPLAQICRNWANELITPIITVGDSDTLVAILLLLIYELSDSTRGITWELLDLAARTCLQLGWHQSHQPPIPAQLPIDGNVSSIIVGGCSADDVRLMCVLKNIEGSLQTIFSRPTMLSGSKLPTSSESEPIYDLYMQIFDQIFGPGQVYETLGCPFVGELGTLMGLLEGVQAHPRIVNESWLLFLPVCFRHKQCIFCFQEADEPNSRGMKSLRRRMVDASAALIQVTHLNATSRDEFKSPMLASCGVLVSGCSIAVSILKRWTSMQTHMKDLMRCTEVLTIFEPHWKGGSDFLSVWRTITDILLSVIYTDNGLVRAPCP